MTLNLLPKSYTRFSSANQTTIAQLMTINRIKLDEHKLCKTFDAFATGVTVITIRRSDGSFSGVTANSFNSVSVSPPLVLWSQSIWAKRFPAFRDCDHFTVNVLAHDQRSLANRFVVSEDEPFSEFDFLEGIHGAPILKGTTACLECKKIDMVSGGDHAVFLGRVEDLHYNGRAPLIYSEGKYKIAQAHELGSYELMAGAAIPVNPKAVDYVKREMPRIAEAVGDHSLCLSVWGNKGPTTVHWEASRKPVSNQLRLGLAMYITQSATGRAFAAFLPEPTTAALIEDELSIYQSPDETREEQRSNFNRMLAEFRDRGISRASHSAPSPAHGSPVTAFSAPIFGPDNHMYMALTVTAPKSRLDPDWNGRTPQELKDSAHKLSKAITHQLLHEKM